MAMDYQKAKDRRGFAQDRVKRMGYATGGDVGQPTVTGKKYLTNAKNDTISEPMQHGPSPSTTDVRDDTHLFQDTGKEYADKGRVMGQPGDDTGMAELTGRLGTRYRKGGKTK